MGSTARYQRNDERPAVAPCKKREEDEEDVNLRRSKRRRASSISNLPIMANRPPFHSSPLVVLILLLSAGAHNTPEASAAAAKSHQREVSQGKEKRRATCHLPLNFPPSILTCVHTQKHWKVGPIGFSFGLQARLTRPH